MTVHVGTSGWSYDHWEGVLYPPGTPLRARLDHYVARFQTVEVNSTLLPLASGRHLRRLAPAPPAGLPADGQGAPGPDPRRPPLRPRALAAPDRRRPDPPGPTLGVLLVQLPPTLPYDHPRLAYFLQQVPSWLRVALEFRHPSWHREEVFTLLADHGAAYCVMSGAGLPCVLRATAPFAYVRLHGPDPHHLYAGSYSEDDLRWWAGAYANGRARGETSTRTSTTTGRATPCATPRPSAVSWARERSAPAHGAHSPQKRSIRAT